MKKYTFFKYFIKNKVFAGGGGGRAGRPIPIGCSIFTPDMILGRGRVYGSGGRMGILKPIFDPSCCHVHRRELVLNY